MVNIVFLKNSVDILADEEDGAIQFEMDNSFYFSLIPSLSQTTNIFFHESALRLNVNYWDFFEFTEDDLFTFEYSQSRSHIMWIAPDQPLEEREYLAIYFRIDSIMNYYKREEYDVLTYFGDLGGLFDFILMFGMLITSAFVNRNFQASLIERAYQW